MGRPDPDRIVRSGEHPVLGALTARPYGAGFALVDVTGPEQASALRAALARHHPDTAPRAGWASVLLACAEPARALDLVLALEVHPGSADLPGSRAHVIGVHYDGEDLGSVAELTGLDVREVVERHTAPEYRVVFLGFTRAFPYLMGLDPALAAVPRLPTPRVRVPGGSVGIAAGQTGIYPMDSPGGWQLLGRAEATLFDQRRTPPGLLAPGDTVRLEAL